MGRLVILAVAFMGLLLLSADAQPERRVALVIGNGTYAEAGTLTNPVNDALDIAGKLRSIGFEVIEGNDLGKRELERKIGEFSDALEGAGVGLFYYAGHGLQVEGRNYIVPVDARLDMPVKLQLEAVPIDEVLDIMEQQTKVSLVFLDACRNNPFARSLSRTATTRSVTALAGLAQFDSTRGSFIAFSTAPGAVAMDGTGRNSPFAAALLRHMAEPGQSINDMMIAVRRDVVSETREGQRPWEQGSLLERFEFVPGGETVAQPKPAVPPAPETKVVALERSVGDDKTAIEKFLRDDYLAPDAAAIGETVKRLYAPSVTIFGTRYDSDAVVKLKTDWFAQFASWSFSLEPGSLNVTRQGENRAEAVFAMSYDYMSKDKSAARMTGKARVTLGLVKSDGQWRIASETSQAMN
ncbi:MULTISPECIES: caspase domain-containing protein [unclassified Mesorhizobium]|uniref:caspase family protein n=1 Tax=unclassified Mesorhizobium TaxID=325217 RepID=UPI0003CE38FB|nr:MULTISPECIES: caspase domain-containing protein [unclassified Mesorhizobium]ESY14098.1 peptidase C14 [Mesorhizobium sp. LNJC395A00]WJI73150.1 caspase domain-containing protein [Mesorhizobium sp. C395A]